MIATDERIQGIHPPAAQRGQRGGIRPDSDDLGVRRIIARLAQRRLGRAHRARGQADHADGLSLEIRQASNGAGLRHHQHVGRGVILAIHHPRRQPRLLLFRRDEIEKTDIGDIRVAAQDQLQGRRRPGDPQELRLQPDARIQAGCRAGDHVAVVGMRDGRRRRDPHRRQRRRPPTARRHTASGQRQQRPPGQTNRRAHPRHHGLPVSLSPAHHRAASHPRVHCKRRAMPTAGALPPATHRPGARCMDPFQSLNGSNSPSPAMATANGRSVCRTRMVPACCASTSGRRR